MSSTYGEHLKLSVFGQSHGPSIGMTLDGIPAGLKVDAEKLQEFLNRRAPGRNDWSTPRREEDRPDFLSGLLDGYTCGAPIAAVIQNKNTRSGDYSNLKNCPRPGHADYTAQIKYGGYQDAAGGGHFSGRLTAPVCIAGGLCLQWLEQLGIAIAAHITQIGQAMDDHFDPMQPQVDSILRHFPVFSAQAEMEMKNEIAQARTNSDSVGGIIECAVVGLPPGIGEPMFGGIESKLAQILYGIPAVKGVEFGAGFACAGMLGSENNDGYQMNGSNIEICSNHAGGILGGISNGLPVIFRVAVKPTPSIAQPQKSVSLSNGENVVLEIKGRHDPCIVPRAVPVIEAAAAIALFDMILGNSQVFGRK